MTMPKKHSLRVTVIALTVIVGIVVIVSGYFLWQQKEVIEPIEGLNKEYRQIHSIDINELNDGQIEVVTELNYEPFLHEMDQKLRYIISNKIDQDTYRLIYVDQRNSELRRALYELNFRLWHYWGNQDFLGLENEIQEMKETHSLDHFQLYMMDGYFFVQMAQDEDYLIETIDYPFKTSRGELDDY